MINKTVQPETYLRSKIQDATVGKTFHLVFCNVPDTSVLNESTPLAQVLAYELTGNGYGRAALDTTLATGPAISWDATAKQAYREWQPVLAVTSGNAHTWNTEVILQDGSATASKDVTALDLGTDRLTVTAHGLANSDRVLLTADSGGTVPTASPAITPTTELFAKSISANEIELYREVGLTTKVDFTAAGTGTYRVRYAKGLARVIGVHDVAQSLSGVSGPTTTTVTVRLAEGTC